MFWIVAGLAAGSLVVSLTTLYVVVIGLRSTRRAERDGNERLEILREQQQRLQFLREERHMLEEELEWRRSTMDVEERQQVELNAPSESNGQAQSEEPNLRLWLWRIIGH
jgi:hypothetical protein